MKRFIITILALTVLVGSVFAIEPKRHLTNEELTAYQETIEVTVAVAFKIQNKSNEDKSVFICLVPSQKK